MIGGRIVTNTRKHILRSGWVGFASIFVMMLAFLVICLFAGLAYVANLYVNFIESKSNVLVFFEVGVDKDIVNELEEKWIQEDGVLDVYYLGEEEAFELYSQYTSRVVPEQYEFLSSFEDKRLPSSLEITLRSLDDLEQVQRVINQDIEAELEELIITNPNDGTEEDEDSEVTRGNSVSLSNGNTEDIFYRYSDEPNDPPIWLVVDNENLETLKEVFFQIRRAGLIVLGFLFLFVGIFIFMTTEFRLYNQKEEIGVMQLVGGSLFFIRMPYVLEGGLYGLFGALLSSTVIGSILYLIFDINRDSTITRYLFEHFGQLNWPEFTPLLWLTIVLALAGVGFILGAISSFLSIRRYIR